MRARKALESGILCQPQSQPVLGPELLQLGHYAISDARDAFGKEAVHHGLVDFQFVLDAEVDEVGVHQHVVRGTELSVVLEEERARRLLHVLRSRGILYYESFFLLRLLFLE